MELHGGRHREAGSCTPCRFAPLVTSDLRPPNEPDHVSAHTPPPAGEDLRHEDCLADSERARLSGGLSRLFDR